MWNLLDKCKKDLPDEVPDALQEHVENQGLASPVGSIRSPKPEDADSAHSALSGEQSLA